MQAHFPEQRLVIEPNSNGDIFTCEENMLFSHVKISSFHAKVHLVFHWCLYNNISLFYDDLFIHTKLAQKRILI